MEESRHIMVSGFVQGVGYRAFIQMMARRLGIKGRVRNLDNGNVEVIASGRPESIEKFPELIHIKAESPFEPDVHEIEVEDYSGDESFDDFRIDYGYDMSVAEKEMIERSEIGILAFGWMGKYLGNKIDTLSEKNDKGFSELGEKIDNVGQKVDTVGNKIDALSEKTDKGFSELGEKIDNVGQKVDTVGNKIDALSEKTDKGFSELGEKMDTGFSDIKNEIKLTREELGEKIDTSNERTGDFHMDMVRKFDALDVKYGIIGQGLNEMNDRFQQLEGDVREMKEAFLRLVNHMTQE